MEALKSELAHTKGALLKAEAELADKIALLEHSDIMIGQKQVRIYIPGTLPTPLPCAILRGTLALYAGRVDDAAYSHTGVECAGELGLTPSQIKRMLAYCYSSLVPRPKLNGRWLVAYCLLCPVHCVP